MAVNRASNSRFIVRDSRTRMVAVTTRPDSRRLSGISNFTATLQPCPLLVSRSQRATSTIIERIQDSGYDLWKIASAFWDAIWRGKRVWELGMLEGASGFCGGPVSELKLDDVPKPLFGV